MLRLGKEIEEHNKDCKNKNCQLRKYSMDKNSIMSRIRKEITDDSKIPSHFNFENMFNKDDEFCDLVFTFDTSDKQIYAHQFMFCGVETFAQKLLKLKNNNIVQRLIYKIDNVSYQCFYQFVTFLYRKEIDIINVLSSKDNVLREHISIAKLFPHEGYIYTLTCVILTKLAKVEGNTKPKREWLAENILYIYYNAPKKIIDLVFTIYNEDVCAHCVEHVYNVVSKMNDTNLNEWLKPTFEKKVINKSPFLKQVDMLMKEYKIDKNLAKTAARYMYENDVDAKVAVESVLKHEVHSKLGVLVDKLLDKINAIENNNNNSNLSAMFNSDSDSE